MEIREQRNRGHMQQGYYVRVSAQRDSDLVRDVIQDQVA